VPLDNVTAKLGDFRAAGRRQSIHHLLDRLRHPGSLPGGAKGPSRVGAEDGGGAARRRQARPGAVHRRQVVSAVAAGRILNPTTASSQILGAVVGGIGIALHEGTLTDRRFGRFMTHTLADYRVPVNADVHAIDVIFVEEKDNGGMACPLVRRKAASRARQQWRRDRCRSSGAFRDWPPTYGMI
jgi:hypothetical protein